MRDHAQARPDQPALVQDDEVITYGQLDALMDRIACGLQRDGLQPGDCIALCGANSPWQAAMFLGALRAGVVLAPVATSSTPASLASMLRDAQARWIVADDTATAVLPTDRLAQCIALTPDAPGVPTFIEQGIAGFTGSTWAGLLVWRCTLDGTFKTDEFLVWARRKPQRYP